MPETDEMSWDSPLRPRTAGRPAWKDCPMVVLPDVLVSPSPEGGFRLKLMFPSPDRYWSFHWIETTLGLAELDRFFDHWYNEPEGAVTRYFGVEPPKHGNFPIRQLPPKEPIIASQRLEDLDL